MSDRESEELIGALEEVLGSHLSGSAPMRRLTRAVGVWLVAQADRAENNEISEESSPAQPLAEPAGSLAGSVSPKNGPVVSEAASPAPHLLEPASGITGPQVVVPAPTQAVPLRLGETDTSVKVFGHPEEVARVHAMVDAEEAEAERFAMLAETEPTLDLGLIATRSSLKAEGCRVLIRRRATVLGSDDEAQCIAEVHRLLDTAKSMRGCLLWMFFREYEHPDDASMEQIARWYDAHAGIARLLVSLEADRRSRRADLEQAMQLFAHANSGLRHVLEATWLTRPDIDQEEGHLWLRWETKARQVLVPRYMRMADTAAPDSIDELLEEFAAFSHDIEDRARQATGISQRLKRIRYHAELLADGRSLDHSHDWGRIESSLEDLEGMGLFATDERVLTAMEELAEAELDTETPGERAAAALAALQEIVTRAEAEETAEPTAARRWSERVKEVRGLLAGRSVVIVGGEERREAIARLTDAFGLAGVEWVALTEHGSGSSLRAPIERPETALVLLLIKLTGHHHVDEAKRYAKAAGKPIVLLKAGYNPERVAFAVLNQASDQLGTAEG